ncbi:hypothetical protein JEJ72_09980 [Klebsiella pneumoniae]|uniref:hypothetical protein n=1 Tax=Klebsiella pneumoniae TaxID=573 RepID=UPI0021176715|nr:hypothetical protein [Klebsiella pneumoniae]MCQ8735495.1 hypothetical protein [Klebsiella pneumoniae]
MSDKDIESEIQAKGLTAPRVTRDDMIANIAHAEIVKHVLGYALKEKLSQQ